MTCLSDVTNFSATSVSVSALLVLLGAFYFLTKNRGLPPGPIGIPYLGYWPFLDNKSPLSQFDRLTKKYGDVFSLTSTGKLVIHLGSISAMKELHVAKSDCFSSKPNRFVMMDSIFGGGLVSKNGECGKIMRRFFIQAFKECGMTSVKDDASGPHYDCLLSTLEDLASNPGKATDMTNILLDRCSTIMRRTVFGEVGITDLELRQLYEAYGKMLETLSRDKLFLYGGIAERFIFPLSPGYRSTAYHRSIMLDLLHKNISQHKSSFDPNRVRDLIDVYIMERNKRVEKGDPMAEYFSDEILTSTLLQVVGDGILSVAGFITCFLRALVEYPEEQEKIYTELLQEVGTERLPVMGDKSRLPYTSAFLYEVIRTTDFSPMLPSAECTAETSFRGHIIPKGAVTLPNYWAANHDSSIYEDPDVFRPSRFVATPEKGRAELPVIFGVGKRACIGEQFTMIQVFLFLATIVQNFRLSKPEGESGEDSVLFTPTNLYVIASPRKLEESNDQYTY